jgi:hypothetical protein
VCEAIGLEYDPAAVRASFDPANAARPPGPLCRGSEEVAEIEARLERQRAASQAPASLAAMPIERIEHDDV